MVTPRASAPWVKRLSQQTLRTARQTSHRRQWPNSQWRTYASSGSNTHKSGSDLPWAITSIVVTVPATWYLLQPQIERITKGKGHGHGHGEHDEHKDEGEHKDEAQGDEPKEEGDKPATEEQETEEVGASEEATPEEGKAEGAEAKDETGEESSENKEEASGSEEKDGAEDGAEDGSLSKQAKKQRGLSNAETRHPTHPSSDPDKSKKPEGIAETAKTEGTVNPAR